VLAVLGTLVDQLTYPELGDSGRVSKEQVKDILEQVDLGCKRVTIYNCATGGPLRADADLQLLRVFVCASTCGGYDV
jgi:hypothetical protein